MNSSRKVDANFGAAFRSISFCFLAVLVLQSEAFNANRPTLRSVVPLDQPSRSPLTSYRNVQNRPVTLLRAKNDFCVDVVSFARDNFSNCFDRRGGFSHHSLFSLKQTWPLDSRRLERELDKKKSQVLSSICCEKSGMDAKSRFLEKQKGT
jgi:hypothetical protein